MAWGSDFKVRLRPGVQREIGEKLAVAWKNAVQECVGETKKRSPVRAHFGGHNRRSINPNGAVNTSGAIDIDPKDICAEIFTTSGYGGYLEVGTRKMSARPYIVPSAEKVMGRGGAGARALGGCLD